MKSFVSAGRTARLGAVIALILAASQLAACGGSDDNDPTPPPSSGGGDTTPPPPSGGGDTTPPPAGGGDTTPDPIPKVSLTFTGKVTDDPIPNAQVTITVGDEDFAGTADANGDYSIDVEIPEEDVDAFVTLSARGVGDQSYVEFKSLAGSFESLLSAAGSDDTLSSSENFATQITNVSTAHAVFMEQVNGGPITTVSALQTSAALVNAQDVLDLAAAIKLAVDDADNNPLPNGTTSILALVSDPATRQTFVSDTYANDPEAFAAAQVAIAQDPKLTQNDGALQRYLDNEGFTTAMLSTDAMFSFNYTGRVAHFDLWAGGEGSESSETYDQSFSWELDGSTIKVTYDAPVETVSYDTVDCNGTVAQIEARYVSNGTNLTLLNERTVAITTTTQISYPSCSSLAPHSETATVARTVLSMDNFKVIDVEELKDNAQTIYVWDASQNAVVADVAEIYADGTGRALLTGQDFTWELNADGGPEEEGKLIAAEFEGWRADYLVFRDMDELSSDLFWEVRVGNDGADGVYMGAGASVFADPDYAVTFTEEDVADRRFYQFGKGDETSGDPRLDGFRLRFDANGVGAQEVDYIDENDDVQLDDTATFRWEIKDGPVGVEIVVSRTYDTGNSSYNCELGATPGCYAFDERRIIPIVANDEGRVYWMEVRRSAPQIGDTVDDDLAPTQLVRFYDYQPETQPAMFSGKPTLRPAATKQRELLRGATKR